MQLLEVRRLHGRRYHQDGAVPQGGGHAQQQVFDAGAALRRRLQVFRRGGTAALPHQGEVMKYSSHPHDWTLERSALLRRLWNDEGLSGGEIAERMGLSRNAVIGRAHRMGLQKRNDRKANAQKANVTK